MSLLQTIFQKRRADVQEARSRVLLSTLKAGIRDRHPTRPFAQSLRRSDRIATIAEIKFRSPSSGLLHDSKSVAEIALDYTRAGADALSILTEPGYFGGSLEYILQAKHASERPVLRKDFLFDEYQIYESRAAGADAILLIAAMLERNQITDLLAASGELGLEVLLELHDERDWEKCHGLEPSAWGVNHRNLSTLEIDMSVSSRMIPLLPPDAVRVAESGISSQSDLQRMRDIGVDAVLVGTSLMRTSDPGAALARLLEP